MHPQNDKNTSRTELLQLHALPLEWRDMRWITIFAYGETLARIEYDTIPDDTLLFVFSNIEQRYQHERIVYLSFVSIREYHGWLTFADAHVVR